MFVQLAWEKSISETFKLRAKTDGLIHQTHFDNNTTFHCDFLYISLAKIQIIFKKQQLGF